MKRKKYLENASISKKNQKKQKQEKKTAVKKKEYCAY